MRHSEVLLATAASAAIVFSCGPAWAQAEAAEGNEIVVTANKRTESINKVGLSVTAVSGGVLTERRATSLEDIGSIAPGLVYTPSTSNTPIFTLRGVGFNESSLGVYPAVSVYVDQTPLPFPVMASHAAFDLERVEVLKGPQGTLFGQNSTGGAINYIAAKPTGTWQAGGDISYGRFNQIDGNAFISGPISDYAGLRLAVTGLHSDDWQKSYTRDDTNGKQSYIAGRLTLELRPSDPISLLFTFNGWRDTSQPQAQQLIATHEQDGQGGSKALDAQVLNDPLRNSYSPPFGGGSSAEMTYPFPTIYNSRVADWTNVALDPNTSPSVQPGSPFSPPNGVTGSSDPALASMTSFDPFSDRKFWQAALRADIKVGGGIVLTSLSSYARYKQDQRTDGDGMAIVGFDLQSDIGRINSFNQELRLANDPARRWRWVLGANYERSNTFEDQLLRYFANPQFAAAKDYINASGDRLSQHIDNVAIFVSSEFNLTDRLTFKASGRYTKSKIHAINAAYTLANGNVDKLFNFLGGPLLGGNSFAPIGPADSYTLNGDPANVATLPKGLTINSPVTTSGFLNLGIPGVPLDATLRQDNVSWRFGMDYRANDDILLYANVSRGYKAGSFPTLAAASYVSGLPVTQEQVTSYEAGVKATLFDRKVQANAAAFYMDYRNKQVRGKLYDIVFGTLDTLTNVPRSRIWGIEGDITIRPINGLTVSTAVTYLNSKVQDFVSFDIFGGVDNSNFNPAGVNTENLKGNVLPYTPKWSGSINVDYRRELGNGGASFVGFTVNAKSGQDAAIGGGTATLPLMPGNRFRIAPGIGLHPYTIDPYATVDARLGYEFPNSQWKMMVWGKNIFNKYYWTAVIPSNDSSARLAGRPATYGVMISFKFQ
ncbi:hypothetical protein ASE00_21185 [Sphingomonas sp. Root710]|uniref:TonB-dependent receptor n=1 Tax=Sphingomonas sp. Root710 TaxID=1736594 RepID=UPI0006F68A29|nr:TonB-dependent receptor [Sphingomonas sp. Root710]KRB78891.1 hypothetical protein ASE00_21185 [Sphingomonas sp. Root710]